MVSFNELEIPEAVKKALEKLQFVTPTEIQGQCLPIALSGKDIIACASTGSGKTGAFGIPALTTIINNPDKNALILAPTRELAQQISEFMRSLTLYAENMTMVSLVGGFDMSRQLSALRRKPRIIIATPGRLTDHLRRRSVNLSNTGILILDEGDRMLDMGFAPQLDVILQFLPTKRQTMMFTATLPPKVKELASKYLHKPQEVTVGRVSQPVDTVKQSAVVVPQDQKNDRLLTELQERQGSMIVFMRTQRRTDALTDFLADEGIDAVSIHGGLTQGKRNRAIQGFKKGAYRVLVATDIAARGIDVPSVEHVINFDLPLMDEDYVHRIGRTGRNGASGEALSFVSHQEYGLWNVIMKKYNIQSDIVDPRKNKKSGGAPRGRRPERRFERSESRSFKKFDSEKSASSDFNNESSAPKESSEGMFKRGRNGFKKKVAPQFTPWEEDSNSSFSREPKRFSKRDDERSFRGRRNRLDGEFSEEAERNEQFFAPKNEPRAFEKNSFEERPFRRNNNDSGGGFKKRFSSREDRDFGPKRDFKRKDGFKPSFGGKKKFGQKSERNGEQDFFSDNAPSEKRFNSSSRFPRNDRPRGGRSDRQDRPKRDFSGDGNREEGFSGRRSFGKGGGRDGGGFRDRNGGGGFGGKKRSFGKKSGDSFRF